jgi:TrmH family RNA methyltransferase
MHSDPKALLREHVVVVLVRPQQSGNVGSVARAMRNMGLHKLVIVAPPTLDIDRARWMAPGSTIILDQARFCATVAEAVADCHLVVATTARNRHWRWPAYDTDQFGAVPFEQAGKTAILFGPEDSGLDNDDIAYAHALLHIPTDAHASLNLSQAVLMVASCIYAEARKRGYVPGEAGVGDNGGPLRGSSPAALPKAIPAPQAMVESLVGDWMKAMEASGYMKGHEEVLVSSTMRQIFQRSGMEEREIVALRGMIKKMRRRMERTP